MALAILDEGRPVPSRRLAARMDIPQGFLAHVLTDLVRAGIASGTTGRSGGYRLALPASQVSLLGVVDAAEDRGTPPRCVIRGGACRTSARCAVHIAFDTANVAMRRELAAATLADLARNEMAVGTGRIGSAGGRIGSSGGRLGSSTKAMGPSRSHREVGTSGPD